ncbi:MAG: extracellular solute-binding protein [Tessaracoccus sp.]|uniref:ABC transporter substrate-binding protein n=1 Tax=Tessaracoccus sp. TaxID=1971211 RepID=UPI001EB2D7F4|nr:extracellular solute-binding protein [Tessaracoccus sp.]MBK7819616.1 extracellular solute-binding protein [Tessaracoccus sp.]
MKKTKLVKFAAASLLAVSVALTGCGGDNGGTPGSGGNTGGGGGDQTLTVWTWDPAFNIFAMQEAEKIYQKDHPDFKLDIQETPWDDLQTKLTTIAQSQSWNELPDIFLMQNNAYQKNVINYPDLVQPLTDSGVTWDEFPESVRAYSTIDGVNYGVPFDAGTAISALRTDIISEAGLTTADFTDITWDKYIELGKQVKEKTGKAMLSGTAGSSDMIMMMLQSSGASLFDDQGNPTIVDNATLNTAVETYVKLVKEGVYVEVNSWDEYVGGFVNGNIAGVVNGIWVVATMQTAEDQAGKWEVTNVPKLDGVAGATNYTANGGSSWAISQTGDFDLAADFLKSTFAGSTELYDIILPKAGAVANWIPAGSSAVYKEPQPFFSDQPIFEMVVDFGSKVPANNTGAYYYEARDAVSAALTKVISGTDMATALAEAQSTVEFAMQ